MRVCEVPICSLSTQSRDKDRRWWGKGGRGVLRPGHQKWNIRRSEITVGRAITKLGGAQGLGCQLCRCIHGLAGHMMELVEQRTPIWKEFQVWWIASLLLHRCWHSWHWHSPHRPTRRDPDVPVVPLHVIASVRCKPIPGLAYTP